MKSSGILENLGYALLLVVMGLVLLFVTFVIVDRVAVRAFPQEVLNKSWQFDQIIEEYRQLHQETRQWSVPGDAYNKSCWTVDDSYYSSSKKSWIHDSHVQCSYDIDRWVQVSTSTTKGSYLDGLRVPEPTVKCNGVEEFGCQRYGKLFRHYYLNILDVQRCEINRKEWDEESIGNSHRFYFTLFTSQLVC